VAAGVAGTASAQLPSVRVTHCEFEGPYATLETLQRDYLAAVRTSVLRKRATQLVGTDDERIEQADDADDVRLKYRYLCMLNPLNAKRAVQTKAALIELILGSVRSINDIHAASVTGPKKTAVSEHASSSSTFVYKIHKLELVSCTLMVTLRPARTYLDCTYLFDWAQAHFLS
jgi:hypothetical protein